MEGHSRDAKKEGKAGCSRRFSRRRRCSVLRSTKGRETERRMLRVKAHGTGLTLFGKAEALDTG